MMEAVESARRAAIERLEERADEAAAQAFDPFWRDGPYNVKRWVERAYRAAVQALESHDPEPNETTQQYMTRLYNVIRGLRDHGPDADDESWYAGAIDDASLLLNE